MSYQPYQYAPRPNRSAIPKVMGILMIVMCSLALLAGLIGFAMGTDKDFGHLPEYQALDKVGKTLGLFGLPISILGFITGILAVSYKRIAPTLAIIYPVLGLIHTIINVIVIKKYTATAIDAMSREMGGGSEIAQTTNSMMSVGMILGAVLYIAWALVVLILMTRPAARAACQN